MPMRVRELVCDPALGLQVVVDGDLDREVRWVHTTELADPSAYLEGDELILTTGVWRSAGITSGRFVAPLRRAGVAALGYGLPDPAAAVPADLVRACRRASLPLLTVPFELPFIAVSRAFVDRVVQERESTLRAVVRRNDRLVRAAGHGSGIAGILAVLEADLRAWVIGPGRRVTHAGPSPAAGDVSMVAAAVAGLQPEYPVAAAGWLAFPVVSVGRTEAHLVVAGEAGRGSDGRAAVDQALPFLGLELARARAARESERRLAGELVDLVMAGPAMHQAAAARLETFGLDPAAPLAAIVCEAGDADAALDAIERHLADAGVAAIAAVKAQELVAIVAWAGPEAGLGALAAALHGAVRDGAVGVGGLVPDAGGLRTSVVEARHACRFARLRRDAGWATHHQVGSHSLLLALQDEDVLAAFRRTLLQPLEEHDARRRSHLVETLDRFLSSGGRWQETATALHVHVNTLRHRLARVEELSGRDLDSMEDRVDLWIALRSRP
jgi:PucR family transcriptional regulator, purine catabolism regulatory protein